MRRKSDDIRAEADVPGLDGLAANAYLSGWALTEAPFTDRVQAGCLAAAALACEHHDDPRILEAAMDLGSLEGIWAVIYRRRDRLLARRTAAVMAAWNDCVTPLDARHLARAFRSAAYLPIEAASPQAQFWRGTATAAALTWLRAVHDSEGYDALIAAIAEAIREGMAEGEADALAVAASQQGKTGFSILKAFRAAYARMENDGTIDATAAAALTAIIDGAGNDLGRQLAAMASDGSSEDEMTAAANDVATGSDVRSVKTWTADKIWAAIGTGVKALYSLAGVQVDWVTDGDPCQACRDNEANGPYSPGRVPSFPQHPHCRCNLSASGKLPLSFLAAFLP